MKPEASSASSKWPNFQECETASLFGCFVCLLLTRLSQQVEEIKRKQCTGLMTARKYRVNSAAALEVSPADGPRCLGSLRPLVRDAALPASLQA